MEGPLFSIRNKMWTKMQRLQTAHCWAKFACSRTLHNLSAIDNERSAHRARGSRAARKARLSAARAAYNTAHRQHRASEARFVAANRAFLAAEEAALIDWNARR
jgi:hypothetical protein